MNETNMYQFKIDIKFDCKDKNKSGFINIYDTRI